MKTLRLILAITAFSGTALVAQDTIPDIEPGYRPAGRFYTGGFISPDLSYSIIPRENSGMPAIRNYQSNYDIPKFSVTVGLEGMYQINENLAVTLGVQYSGKGGKTKEIEYGPSAVDTDPVSMYYVYDYRYIDVPLRLDLYFTRRKVSPFITAGVSTNFFINQRTHVFGIDKYDEAVEMSGSTTSGFSAVTPQLQVGAGIDIALKYSRIRIFPIYRLALTDTKVSESYTYSTGTVNAKLYSVGLGINCFFRH